MARSSAGQSSISRAVRVIEAFDVGVRDLSLTDIAARTGMALTTVHRLVGELVDLGLLERLENRRYRVGLRMWELAIRTPGAIGIREIALPHMRRVQAMVRQHTQLGVLQGDSMLYLERLSAPDPIVNLTIVGGRLPWHATSSGLVLAAGADDETRERLLTAPLQPHRLAPTPKPHDMRRQLREIRAQGFAVTRGYIRAEATAIAVPVKGPFDLPVAALAVVVPTAEGSHTETIALLRHAAAAIATDVRRTYSGSS